MLNTTHKVDKSYLAKDLHDLNVTHGHIINSCRAVIESVGSTETRALVKDIAVTHREHQHELEEKINELAGGPLKLNPVVEAVRKVDIPLTIVRTDQALLDELLTKEQMLVLEYERGLNSFNDVNGLERLMQSHFDELNAVCDALQEAILHYE